jgi:hypothetical protein
MTISPSVCHLFTPIGTLYVHNDKLEGTFAYRIPVGKKKKVKISLGVGVSATNVRAALTDVGLVQGQDARFQNNVNIWLPNVSAGIYVYSPKFFVRIDSATYTVQLIDQTGSGMGA